jgi:hypothetical protein
MKKQKEIVLYIEDRRVKKYESRLGILKSWLFYFFTDQYNRVTNRQNSKKYPIHW